MRVLVLKNDTHIIKDKKLVLERHFVELLTATVSHDMRTPLNSIIVVSDIMDSEVTLKGKMMLGFIQNSAKILNFLIEDLLDFYQLKNGQFTLN